MSGSGAFSAFSACVRLCSGNKIDNFQNVPRMGYSYSSSCTSRLRQKAGQDKFLNVSMYI